MAERQIEFSEIKVGDRIRAEYEDKAIGLKFTQEGVVHQKAAWSEDHWETAQHGIIASKTAEGETYFLIPRELPTVPGSVIIATEVRGKQGEWLLYLSLDDDWLSADEIDEATWHEPQYITAWKPAKVVPA